MTLVIQRRIHAFRNALVMAADTHSHECFHMPRWRVELNGFPRGCCALTSHFLAQYLKEGDPTLEPQIISMCTTLEFREAKSSTIESHVIVKLDTWYIDLTLNQFAEYSDRVYIDEKGVHATLLCNIKKYKGTVGKREITLKAGHLDGSELYGWLRDKADGLLAAN
ncbi:hypothetical protein SJI19_19275 [Acerihabitans sp. TG2]|uniref:hypothetical protein n=1 Tax=Acerihabitans sp. TG2 TaxID=3096008 RepID=UPI002B226688|nr:hypothetical protein [Acerihabitans sp. TG2]MEA9392650.1 hypothetical protein [Acerihabitans sp. TG2]